MAKGEIAHHEQFHLWPQCFQKSSAAEASESVCMWERVKLVYAVDDFEKNILFIWKITIKMIIIIEKS